MSCSKLKIVDEKRVIYEQTHNEKNMKYRIRKYDDTSSQTIHKTEKQNETTVVKRTWAYHC